MGAFGVMIEDKVNKIDKVFTPPPSKEAVSPEDIWEAHC
jgi:hypothetical protein